MRYKLIIFDFDGTLADTFSWFLTAANEASVTFKFRTIREDEIESMRLLESRAILKSLGIRWWKLPKLAVYMREQMTRDLHSINLFAGVDQMLRDLSKTNVQLAIVSSNSEHNVRTILGPELCQLISTFACGSSMFGKKKKFREVMKGLNFRSSETLCIGDETRDIEAARNVGAKAGSVVWGYSHADALKKKIPDHLFLSTDDIVKTNELTY